MNKEEYPGTEPFDDTQSLAEDAPMPMGKLRVLYLDDEVNNLQAFKAAFRRDFEVFIAENAKEASKILEDNIETVSMYDVEFTRTSIHVIVADQRMPDTTGVEFFESILEKYAEPMRVLITGYSDLEAVIEAINRGRIFHYIAKPWVEKDLRHIIESAYNIYSLRESTNATVRKHRKMFKLYKEE